MEVQSNEEGNDWSDNNKKLTFSFGLTLPLQHATSNRPMDLKNISEERLQADIKGNLLSRAYTKADKEVQVDFMNFLPGVTPKATFDQEGFGKYVSAQYNILIQVPC